MSRFLLLILIIGFVFASCSEENTVSTVSNQDILPQWLIPEDEVFDSGVGTDGIPSIDNPQFSPPEDINSAFDNELVLGFEYQGEYKAYPIPILDWHEIVNDNIKGLNYAITYCPLTGTGIGWGRDIFGSNNTFGVSGLLYNTNLMPYDRRTNSTWSQMEDLCVSGVRRGDKPEKLSLIHTSFKTWKSSFPNSQIMNANTGFDRIYAFYPYGNYRSDHDRILFPVKNSDNRLPNKERVLGVIIDGQLKVYPFNTNIPGSQIIEDTFQGQNLIIVRSFEENFIVAFLNPFESKFAVSAHPLPSIIQDQDGTRYNLFGQVVNGSSAETLERPISMMGYWFSWVSFYDDIEIYSE